MLRYTNKFKNECKRYKLDGDQRAIADLIIMGWNPKDAYIAIGKYNATLSDEYHLNQIEEFKTLDFNEYLKKRERKLELQMKGIKTPDDDTGQGSEESKGKFRTKDEVIDALASTVDSLHGKDKADVLMKLADLQRMKQEEVVEEDNTIHFYLPISCKMCDLYNKEKERRRKQWLKEQKENGEDEE